MGKSEFTTDTGFWKALFDTFMKSKRKKYQKTIKALVETESVSDAIRTTVQGPRAFKVLWFCADNKSKEAVQKLQIEEITHALAANRLPIIWEEMSEHFSDPIPAGL